jgi:saccharopine dehydrogenase-like NADP-dependent oxidoreductase
MQNILILGAGRSSSYLIKYLLDNSVSHNWTVTVADVSLELSQQKTNGHANSKAISFDVNNDEQRQKEISKADMVISMLPAFLHIKVAEDCVAMKKNMVTASYISKEIKALDESAKEAGIVLMNEIGLDPGIDHMSAMHIIDSIKYEGGEITAFRSYCGGLVAPESNDNPWGYKFTWNPRNVILAGQGTAQYIENSKIKHIPYNRLYSQIDTIFIKDHGSFEAYANRDSLSYRHPYGLDNIPTLLRGTLRMPAYCKAWNIFVKLGITDDTYTIADSETLTYKQLIESYLPESTLQFPIKQRVAMFVGNNADSKAIDMVEWTGILEDVKIGLPDATPAQILQHLLEQKWVLNPTDKDMIVMQHQFEYTVEGKSKTHVSSMVVIGEDQVYTSMAKTVGLPMAIAAKLILTGKIKVKGVQMPISKDVYEPVLEELKSFGVNFFEETTN